MRLSSRYYLLIVLAPLVLLVSGSMLLNLWIDPRDTLLYQRLSTRVYTLPTLLTALERPFVSESDAEVCLLGTSRSLQGHEMLPDPKIINLGINGANNRLIDNLLVGLLQTSSRSRVYFVDTMGGRGDIWGELEESSLRYLLSGGTTKQSILTIADEMRKRFLTPPGSPPESITTSEPRKVDLAWDREWDRQIIEFLRSSLPVGPDTASEIRRRVERIRQLAVPHDALVVFYSGPQAQKSGSDPLILAALQARDSLWRQAIEESKMMGPSSLDVSLTDVKHPRITVAYKSYATPEDWGEPLAPEVWATANWHDALHYNPTVGGALLDRFMSDAAEIQSQAAASETDSARSPGANR